MYISATLPYSLETLISFLSAYHQGIWPLHIVALCLVLLVLWQIKQTSKFSGRIIGSVLTAFWLFVGYVFYISAFSNISFMAPYSGALFMVEGLIIFYIGVFRDHLKGRPLAYSNKKLAIGLLAISLLLYPALVVYVTQSMNALPLVGITPLATAIFTLAIVLTRQAPFKLTCVLCIVPVLHILLSFIFAGLLLL